MKIATHGFSIIEVRDDVRIECFRNRPTVRKYAVARMRVFDLARDRKWSLLESRTFEIWDGINPLTKFVFNGHMLISEKEYLLPTPKHETDRDFEFIVRNRRNNQRTGAMRGDLNNWIKDDNRLPTVLAQMGYAKEYQEPGKKDITRVFGSGHEMNMSHPTEVRDRAWYWGRMKART